MAQTCKGLSWGLDIKTQLLEILESLRFSYPKWLNYIKSYGLPALREKGKVIFCN